MKNVFQLFYVSNSTEDQADVSKILKTAQVTNADLGITGVLLFRRGIFLQLLEGDQDKVEALFAKIENDPRHANVIRIFDTKNSERLFNDWSMGFYEVGELEVKMVNEILSWNKLINASKDIDKYVILSMLERFKGKFKEQPAVAAS